jgi:hypothetical protein
VTYSGGSHPKYEAGCWPLARALCVASARSLEGRVSTSTSLSAEEVLRNYFHAKDENRPHLLAHVFTETAVLEVRNRTSTITFPNATSGREAIADVLVRSFGQTYENVYSFYLRRPVGQPSKFECPWLVAMTEKSSRNVSIGCGSYGWEFETNPPNLARRLTIDIAEMQVLAPSDAAKNFAAVAALSYPWSSLAELTDAALRHPVLAPIARRLSAE